MGPQTEVQLSQLKVVGLTWQAGLDMQRDCEYEKLMHGTDVSVNFQM